MAEASPTLHQPIRDHKRIAKAVARWFTTNARELPWREEDPSLGRRDAYRSLVSELMLQQTQVSRVLEKFDPFLTRFPSIQALASADEQEILAAWSGLGYYRRARLLHAAAKDIVEHHLGEVPRDTQDLQSITGIGRYTAGAIASIVFNQPAPIVDGNVSRVLMRLRADGRSAADSAATKQNWADAEQLAKAAPSPAKTNEGLMELGALICTPKTPRCEDCPLRASCRAADLGIQLQIPAPKPTTKRSVIHHTSVIIRTADGRLLIERRPASGLWASMWQAPTAESAQRAPRPATILRKLGLSVKSRKIGEFSHITSHREVRFRIYRLAEDLPAHQIEALARPDAYAAIAPSELGDFALANPHRRMLEDAAKSP
ncbi:MAG: A/G-specific adenine glycosylase [Phycisphaerales bacterium JB065]